MPSKSAEFLKFHSEVLERYGSDLTECLYFSNTLIKDFIDKYIYDSFFASGKKEENPNLVFLSYSEMSTFNLCRQKWEFEYVERLKKKVEVHYFFIGRLCHSALEFLYTIKAFGTELRTSQLVSFFVLIANIGIDRNHELYPERVDDIDLLRHQIDLGVAVLTGYMKHMFPHDSFKPAVFNGKVAAEIKFSQPIPTPSGNMSNKFRRTGKLDLIAEYLGKYWLVEHKFLGSWDASDIKFLSVDPQTASYIWGAEKELGITIAGCIYNVCRKSSLRLGKTEDKSTYRARIIKDYSVRPDYYFERHNIYFNRREIENVPTNIYHMAKDMNNPHIYPAGVFVCKRTGCLFQDLCISRGDEGLKKEYFVKKIAKHEELI